MIPSDNPCVRGMAFHGVCACNAGGDPGTKKAILLRKVSSGCGVSNIAFRGMDCCNRPVGTLDRGMRVGSFIGRMRFMNGRVRWVKSVRWVFPFLVGRRGDFALHRLFS